MPPRREPATLYAISLANLTRVIEHNVRIFLTCGPIHANRALTFLHNAVSCLPLSLKSELALKALMCADEFFYECRPAIMPDLKHLLCVVISEDITEISTQKLSHFVVCRAVANRVCDLLNFRAYANLQHAHENVDTLSRLQKLKSLSNLKEIILPYWFNDQIALFLGQSCPNLQVLDVKDSPKMTDASIPSLTRCGDLRVVLVSSTGLTASGYRDLLQLPHLQKIGFCPRLNTIIASIQDAKPSGSVLSLREYVSDKSPDVTTLDMCPDLTTVIVTGVSTATELPCKVAKLTVQTASHVGSYLNKVLHANITSLELVNCVLSSTTVEAIAVLCVNLRHFRLLSDGNGNVRFHDRKQGLFGCLETLDITSSYLAFDILEVAQNIRFFTSRGKSHPNGCNGCWTGHKLRQVLHKNPMKNLESFRLSSHCEATVDDIIYFLRACPMLRTLGDTHCLGLKEQHFAEIRQAIEQDNFEVELVI